MEFIHDPKLPYIIDMVNNLCKFNTAKKNQYNEKLVSIHTDDSSVCFGFDPVDVNCMIIKNETIEFDFYNKTRLEIWRDINNNLVTF